MATTCSNCGSKTTETERICAACGWDPVARKLAGKPAGLDLLFPSAPAAPPAPSDFEKEPSSFYGAPKSAVPAPPADPFAAITRENKSKAAPAPFPSNLLNPLLESLERRDIGRAVLDNPYAQAAVAALRKPRVFVAAASAIGVWFAMTIYFLWPDTTPPAKPISAPAAEEGYVRRSATFAATPKVIVNSPSFPEPAIAPSSATAPAPR